MRTIRASRLPLALSCPASQLPPATALADDSPESRLGSAVHQALAVLVRDGGGSFPETIEDAAAEWRCDLQECARLAWNGRAAWARLAELFAAPEIECELFAWDEAERLKLTGHVDVLSPTFEDGIRILDWKTGHADENHEQQMRAYIWLALRTYTGHEFAEAYVVRLREMTVDTYRWTRRELDHWYAGVVRDTADVERYRPGRHCGFCPRRIECVATRDATVAAITGLIAAEPRLPNRLRWDDAVIDGYDRLRLVEAACDRARELIRADVAFSGGSVTASDGRTLTLTRQDRQEIDAGRAWPILEQRFGLDAVAAAAKLTKTAVTGLAMDAAPYGKKGSAAKEIMERLDQAGAVTINSIERLEVKRGSNSREIAEHDTIPALPGHADEG